MSPSALINTFWEVQYNLPYSDPIIFHFVDDSIVRTNSGTKFYWKILPDNKIEIFIPDYISLCGRYNNNEIIGEIAYSEYSGLEWSWTCKRHYPTPEPIVSDISIQDIVNGRWTIKNNINLADNHLTFSSNGCVNSSLYGNGTWKITDQTLVIQTANKFITYKFKIINNKWVGSARNEMGDTWEAQFIHSYVIPKKAASVKQKEDKLALLYSKRKHDADYIISFLKEIGITCFYHFTDISNISSIKTNGGLYSWFYCKQNNITISKPGGDDLSRSLDRQYNLHDYVRLSFCKDHPMLYICKKSQRITNPVILEISIEVATISTTLFSDINAADRYHKIGEDIAFLRQLNYGLFKRSYFDLSEVEKKKYQAEILVKSYIPTKFIKNL